MNFDLVIYTKDDAFLEAIEFNFDELKEALIKSLEQYQGLEFTDNEIQEAKNTRAGFNKFINALDDRRKEIKKRCLKPYETFEQRLNELKLLVQEPATAIDNKIKDFEERQKKEKEEKVEAIFNSQIQLMPNLQGIITIKKIFDNKWLNQAVSLNKVQSDILAILDKIKEDFKTLDAYEDAYKLMMKGAYLENLDLRDALKEKTKLDNLKMLEDERREAIRARAIEEAQKPLKQPEQTKAPEIIPQPLPRQIITAEAPKPEELQQIDFRVWVNSEQKAKMREFFLSNNIKYGSVPKAEKAAA
jgi:hypothetical protein